MDGQSAPRGLHGKTTRDQWLIACAAAVVYYALARLGLLFAHGPAHVPALWPAAGFALAAALLWGPRTAAGVFLGAWLAAQGSLSGESVLIGLGAAAQAILGAALLRRLYPAEALLLRAREATAFCALAPLLALIGPIARSLAAAIASSGDPAQAGFAWWTADIAGILVAAPLVLVWGRPWTKPALPTAARAAEGLAAALVLGICAAPAFGARDAPTPFAAFPPLLWILFRFGPRASTAAVAAVAASAAWQAQQGGLFAFGSIAALSATCLVARAALAERARALKALAARGAAARYRLEKSEEAAHERGATLSLLRENAHLLLLMVESVRDYAIFRLDSSGRVASWTSGAQFIYGYGAEEILGSPYSRFMPIEDLESGVVGRRLDEVAREGWIKTETWSVRKDGTRFWADLVLTTLRAETDAPLGYVIVARDATQRRLDEQTLQRRSAELSRSNIELAEFAYVASHDLSSPLHKVTAFAQRLKEKLEGKLDEEGADYLRRMLRATESMQHLIESLLQLARVTTRGAPPAVVDLGTLAKDVVESFELAPTRGRVEIGPLPRIQADALQMRQLLQNLISNGLKFQRPGARPHVRLRGRTTGDGRCEIIVSDDGIGFDMKYAEGIFQPLQRLNGRFEYEGSGLGLAICRKIVIRHGGEISAVSAPGRGAEFKVILPVTQEGRMECQLLEKTSS